MRKVKFWIPVACFASYNIFWIWCKSELFSLSRQELGMLRTSSGIILVISILNFPALCASSFLMLFGWSVDWNVQLFSGLMDFGSKLDCKWFFSVRFRSSCRLPGLFQGLDQYFIYVLSIHILNCCAGGLQSLEGWFNLVICAYRVNFIGAVHRNYSAWLWLVWKPKVLVLISF